MLCCSYKTKMLNFKPSSNVKYIPKLCQYSANLANITSSHAIDSVCDKSSV